MQTLHFGIDLRGDAAAVQSHLAVQPAALVIAGWTGRDHAAIEHHIAELEALGVPAPSAVPLFYRASAQLLTQSSCIEALGQDSSGEAEPVLFNAQGQWWLTVGSDHTDRSVERYGVAVSKQMCPKPVACAAWCWQDVEQHQDQLVLRSRIFEHGQWVSYQEGPLSLIRPLQELLTSSPLDPMGTSNPAAHDGQFLSCGTLAARPNGEGVAIRSASAMEIELFDPVLSRRIVHRYTTRSLEIVQ